MPRSVAVFVAGILILGCSPHRATRHDPQDNGTADSPRLPSLLAARHLPNVVQIHSKVISGGLPESDNAFRELAELGVQTIISVDGAQPDVGAAAKFGMRYVHLPHGYDGVPQQRVEELAKAVRDLDGGIYIHCHHGRHRSPAAATVACIAAGMLPRDQALPILRMAGTSPHYVGLYRAAQTADVLSPSLLDKLHVAFRERAQVPPMAEAMVGLERVHRQLSELADSGWQLPAHHPDLAASHQALLLQEGFAELLRTEEVQRRPAEFRRLLSESLAAAGDLQETVRGWETTLRSGDPPPSLARLISSITANCKTCHRKYRDRPT